MHNRPGWQSARSAISEGVRRRACRPFHAEVAAHLLIAFLFVYRGLDALPQFDRHLARFAAKRIPLPRLVLGGGIATMLSGGALLALGLWTAYAAAALILFTVLANLIYHDFWAMEPGQPRETHRYLFCNNIAVIGGLTLAIAVA